MGSDASTSGLRPLRATLRSRLLRVPGVGSLLARRPLRACLCIILLLFACFVILWRLDLFNITFTVWVPYFFRPFWDRDRRYHYSHVLPNYGWSGDASSTCTLYGMEPVSEKAHVFDIFLFSGEKDLLEVRLRTLADVVDKFVILEGTETFQGQPKKLVYPTIKDDPVFAPFRDRIQYRVVDTKSGGGFKAEGTHRGNNMLKAAEEAGLSEGDIFTVADLDEIPRPDILRVLSSCGPWPEGTMRIQLDLRNQLYAFSLTYRERTRAASVNRYDSNVPIGQSFTHGPTSGVIIADAGWHCSWCLESLSQFKAKALGYSHQDRFLHRKVATTSAEFQRRVCERLPTVDGFIPEAYDYKEMAMLSLPLRFTASSNRGKEGWEDSSDFSDRDSLARTDVDVPEPVKRDPKFNYLLMDCRRPEFDTEESRIEMQKEKPWGLQWQFGGGELPWLD
ncbi:hypothetical protein FOL47_010279 [Perkinsus chesapeaki]|uniref:Beta-1,4-mannosyl-glycoprotein 4-beta-N-acetylglucosaminyltransferase n=1 Tax=Perkinsus chesapeaki TaxID=330153 RepID=A0A7J6L3Y7_PERCH|nr:hypothetical protein FOL47_010279 [Perkinsus chesapeaki]